MAETWIALSDWPYEVSSLGQIRRSSGGKPGATAGRILKAHRQKNGYFFVTLCGARGHVRRSVHSLVCEAFHGKPLPGQQVRHLDGSRDRNIPNNLAWGYAWEDAGDKRRHGTLLIGDSHPRAVLTDAQVAEVLARWCESPRGYCLTGQFIAAICAEFKVSKSHVEAIIYRRNDPTRSDRGSRVLIEGRPR